MPNDENGGNIQYMPERRNEPQQLIVPHWVIGTAVTLALFLIVQYGTTVWWASQLSAKVDANRSLILDRTMDRYTSSEAIKDMQAIKFRFERNERRIDLIEKELKVKK